LEKAATDSHEGRKPQFPLWLAPTQVRIIPLRDEFNDFCEKLADKISINSIRVDIDDRNESIGKRIREAETEWIRYIIVIGEKEANSENLSIRDRTSGSVRELPFDQFLNEIKEQTKDKPFTGLNFPKHISKRPNLMV
ncbi:MAG: His/Gly/Thr/Pro-type tRNA ligase C-terminal domain-containing protein, partial [Candidatus Nitrosopumilus limneticus]|nr:His/Gly/Thr/Pro-type tRNA ligase C-terminal domain-containing protein [Candidatus Nitrosopumilus limneticus]